MSFVYIRIPVQPERAGEARRADSASISKSFHKWDTSFSVVFVAFFPLSADLKIEKGPFSPIKDKFIFE